MKIFLMVKDDYDIGDCISLDYCVQKFLCFFGISDFDDIMGGFEDERKLKYCFCVFFLLMSSVGVNIDLIYDFLFWLKNWLVIDWLIVV